MDGPPPPLSGVAAPRPRWRLLAVALRIASGSLVAYCGAKGSPQPPLHAEAADAGPAAADAGPAAPSLTDGGAP